MVPGKDLFFLILTRMRLVGSRSGMGYCRLKRPLVKELELFRVILRMIIVGLGRRLLIFPLSWQRRIQFMNQGLWLILGQIRMTKRRLTRLQIVLRKGRILTLLRLIGPRITRMNVPLIMNVGILLKRPRSLVNGPLRKFIRYENRSLGKHRKIVKKLIFRGKFHTKHNRK